MASDHQQLVIVLGAMAVFTMLLLILQRVLTYVFNSSDTIMAPSNFVRNSVPSIPAAPEHVSPSLETGNEHPGSEHNAQWDQGDHGLEWEPASVGNTSPPPLSSYNFPANPELTEQGSTVPAAFEHEGNGLWQARF